jgi:DNA-binding MarR family transcriptional regulator
VFIITDEGLDFETIIFDYIDEFKFLFFPDQWSTVFLDYSKNEILVLLYLYKKKTANMTELSEYICAPLNTATGVVSRLEKKIMVERVRGNEDRRVVNIVLTSAAEAFIEEEKKLLGYYFNEIYKSLTGEEKAAGISIINKVISVLKKGKSKETQDNTNKKVKRINID